MAKVDYFFGWREKKTGIRNHSHSLEGCKAIAMGEGYQLG